MNLIKVSVENINGVLVTTSNRVAEELGVNHKDLLEKIEGYIEKFTKAESSALGESIDFKEFYMPSSYKVKSNFKSYKNYLITEKGIAQLVGGYSAVRNS
jgi:phage regulator Rha-like protein